MENQQDQPQQEEIEVNFRFDSDARTIRTDQDTYSAGTSAIDSPPVQQYEPLSVLGELCSIISPKENSIGTSEAAETTPPPTTTLKWNDSLVDDLLFDCEISDCGLMPRTFWMPCQGMEPRCSLEQMAMDVFRHHVKDNANYDPKTSGAEWWVQIRPSPDKVGRYAMHDTAKTNNDDGNNETNGKDMAKEGISFHWDKDEDLRILCGGNTYVHPHLSTVTYLSDLGAPTLALNIRVNNLTGEWIMPNNNNASINSSSNNNQHKKIEGFLSWPKFGKHMSFDGRFLHAAPADLLEKGTFQKQCKIPDTNNDDKSAKTKLQRRHRRVTFLVNIWLNYKPFGVNPFPDTMISKLSGHDESQARVSLQFPHMEDTGDEPIKGTKISIVNMTKDDKDSNPQRFQWPMGDCDSGESIEADIPLRTVRAGTLQGGSLRILWSEANGVVLINSNPTTTSSKVLTIPDGDIEKRDAKRPRSDKT